MVDTENLVAGNEKTQIFNGMTFYMRPCSIRLNIRKLLEARGGTFSKEADGSVIILTNSLTHNSGYHVDLVCDSIDKNKLQDINKYKLPSYNLKYVVNNTKVKIPVLQINKARQRYMPEEDGAIFNYITNFGIQNGEIGSTGGNIIWKEMERKNVTIHSWQSMKNRYFNHIQHNKPKFNFVPLEMSRCSGGYISRFPKASSSHNVANDKLQKSVDIFQTASSCESQHNIVSDIQLSKSNDKYSNSHLSNYQANVDVSNDSDDFDANLLKEAEKSSCSTPRINLTSQNSTFNSNEDGPTFCECYEKYDYTKAVKTLQYIDNIPVGDHIWTSISNQFILEDIALKYGMSSDEVGQIVEKYSREK